MIKWFRKAYADRRARKQAKRLDEQRRIEQQRTKALAEAERRIEEQRAARRAEEELRALLEQEDAALRKALDLEREAELAAERAARQAQLAEQRAAREAARRKAKEQEGEEMRRWLNPFQVGGKYENRKGSYTVMELSGNEMRIRWDSGEEAVVNVASQARILHNIQRGDYVSCDDVETGFSLRSLEPCDESYQVRCARCGVPVAEAKAHYHLGKPYGSNCFKIVTDE